MNFENLDSRLRGNDGIERGNDYISASTRQGASTVRGSWDWVTMTMCCSADELRTKGEQIYDLIKTLYPICRSITGEGVRATLRIIKERIPLDIRQIPSGTKVFDWTVPKEWNIKDASFTDSAGRKIVDFRDSNLHVLNYSVPVNRKMPLAELREHLFTLPEHPDWIPYLTTYYRQDWGFCLTHRQYQQLKDDVYHVVIDATLENGYMNWGEMYLPGKTDKEVLLTCYICHPSLCNDNLSGPAVLAFLADYLQGIDRKYSYRFLFIPETIGAITWLSLNETAVHKIEHGLVATCLGDPGKSTYKKSRRGNAVIDGAAQQVLAESGQPYEILDFFPSGSDERQFCSPGFDLPVGSLMRTPYARFPEYHTSADNLDLVAPEYLADSFAKYVKIVSILEQNGRYVNLNPKCEPQLGRRGLYQMIGGRKGNSTDQSALLWVLNFSDGSHSLLDIAVRSGLRFDQIRSAADVLLEKKLLRPV